MVAVAVVPVLAVYSVSDLAVVADYLVGLVVSGWAVADGLILISETYSKTVHIH